VHRIGDVTSGMQHNDATADHTKRNGAGVESRGELEVRLSRAGERIQIFGRPE
jgi:hypothetical protein